MQILKYFYEEPAALEVLAADDDPDARRRSAATSLEDYLNQPRYFRGYLTATDLEAQRFGLTCLPKETFSILLHAIIGVRPAKICCEGGIERSFRPSELQHRSGDVIAVIIGDGREPACVEAVSTADRRRSAPALRQILDSGRIVLLPEPAHHGMDLSLFAAIPLRPGVEAGMKHILGTGIRAFSIPHREVRSEEKFYFERYDLERFGGKELKIG